MSLVASVACAEDMFGMHVDSAPLRTLTHRGGGRVFALPSNVFGLPKTFEPLPLLVIAPEAEFASDVFSSFCEGLLIQRNLWGMRVSYGDTLRLTASSHVGAARVSDNIPFARTSQHLFCYDLEMALQIALGRRMHVDVLASSALVVGAVASRARKLGIPTAPDFGWTTVGIRVDGSL
jgi:hypothetical protein